MDSTQMIYEGLKQRILEYISISKDDADYNWKNGWDFESMIDEADEEAIRLVEEIEKLTFFLDDEMIEDLTAFVHIAYNNVEDYILETYATDLEEAEEA